MVSISPIMHMSIKIIVCLKIVVKIKETPQKMLKVKKSEKTTLCFNKKETLHEKVTVIGDSMMKYLRRKYFPLSVSDENCSKPLF